MRVRIMLVPFVAAAALLAGCTTGTPAAIPTPTPTTNGLESLTADEILAKATDALKGAKSFRAKGSGQSDGQKVAVDLTFAGDDAKGNITLEGLTVDVVQLSGSAYMKAPEAFWKMFLPANVQALALPLVSGKYVKVPSTSSIIPSVSTLLKPDGTVTKGDVTTVDGKPAITVETKDGKLHISLIGKAYPLDLVSDDGTIQFIDIDQDVTITAPPAAEVVDLSSFAG